VTVAALVVLAAATASFAALCGSIWLAEVTACALLPFKYVFDATVGVALPSNVYILTYSMSKKAFSRIEASELGLSTHMPQHSAPLQLRNTAPKPVIHDKGLESHVEPA